MGCDNGIENDIQHNRNIRNCLWTKWDNFWFIRVEARRRDEFRDTHTHSTRVSLLYCKSFISIFFLIALETQHSLSALFELPDISSCGCYSKDGWAFILFTSFGCFCFHCCFHSDKSREIKEGEIRKTLRFLCRFTLNMFNQRSMITFLLRAIARIFLSLNCARSNLPVCVYVSTFILIWWLSYHHENSHFKIQKHYSLSLTPSYSLPSLSSLLTSHPTISIRSVPVSFIVLYIFYSLSLPNALPVWCQ